MATPSQSSPLTKELVLSILDFLLRQREDRAHTAAASFLRVAVQCLERVYGVRLSDYRRGSAPLAEVVGRAARPVPVRRRAEAAAARAEGNRLAARGLWAQAEREYSRAVALDEYDAASFCNRAAAWIALGKFRKAVADCSRAIGMDNRYAKAYARLGQAYWLTGQPDKAARTFRKGLSMEPDNVNLLRSLERVTAAGDGRPPLFRLKQNMMRLASNIRMMRHEHSMGWRYQAFEGDASDDERAEVLSLSEPLD